MSDKILVIDDSRMERTLTTLMLEKSGFAVITLDSGRNCMSVIDKEGPAAVLLDIIMPDIDGMEVLRQIRSRWSQVELPVIMVTSKVDASDVIEALKMGANDFISKPVDYDVARRRIETHLSITRLSRDLVRLSEIEAVGAMIATYNHEINNPLTIVIGLLNELKNQKPEDERIQKMEKHLWRIAEVVKKTREVLDSGSVEFEKYMGFSKTVRIRM